MKSSEILLQNLEKLHTTPLGMQRIKGNLELKTDHVMDHIKKQIQSPSCSIRCLGKNYYAEIETVCYTINASSYTVITAHKLTHK